MITEHQLDLIEAQQLVTNAELHVAKQRAQVVRLQAEGRDAVSAQYKLGMLKQSLVLARTRLQEVLDRQEV